MKNDKTIIDFSKRNTESKWVDIVDNFSLKIAPIWFNYLSWILIIGVFQYLSEGQSLQQQKNIINFIKITSIALLWLYTWAIFYKVEFVNFPLIKNKKIEIIISVLISGGFAYGSFRLSTILVDIVKTSN